MAEPTQFESAVASVGQQFATVLSAPVPFLIIVALVGVAIWKILNHHYAGRLATKDDLIALRDAQLADYKDKLDGASPDAAKARMDALEERLEQIAKGFEADRPRRIAVDQRAAMSGALDGFRGQSVMISSDAASADAAVISPSIGAAFSAAGWGVRNAIVMGVGNPPPTGIALKVSDPANLTPEQQAISTALKVAGLEFDIQSGGSGPLGGPREIKLPVAEILLTNRPRD